MKVRKGIVLFGYMIYVTGIKVLFFYRNLYNLDLDRIA